MNPTITTKPTWCIFCKKKTNMISIPASKTSTMPDLELCRQGNTQTLWVTRGRLLLGWLEIWVAKKLILCCTQNHLPITWVRLLSLSTSMRSIMPTSATNQPAAVSKQMLNLRRAQTPPMRSKQNSKLKLWQSFPFRLVRLTNAFFLKH